MKKPLSIISYDDFGKMIQSHLESLFNKNCDLTLLACNYETAYKKIDQLVNIRNDLLALLYFSGKIFIGLYQKLNKVICFNCLLLALSRNPKQFDIELTDISELKQPQNIYFPPLTGSNIAYLAKNIYLNTKKTKNLLNILITDIHLGKVQYETLLPEPLCKYCNHTLKSSIPTLTIKTSSSQKHYNDDVTRTKSLNNVYQTLRDHCLGKHIGIINEVFYDFQMPFGSCSAYLALHNRKREPTLGRSSRFDHAKAIAILEGLERLSGFRGEYNKITIESSYNNIKNSAVDPRQLGLHSKEQYKLKNFPFIEYTDDLILPWVKGLDITSSKKIWLPKCMAFYGKLSNPKSKNIVFATSNGCAIGYSIEEAILHGILELVERDAFLMAWYKKTTLENISIILNNTPSLMNLYEKAKLFTGSSIKLLNSTMEHGIPSVIAIAINNNLNNPSTAIAAGSGMNLIHAAKSALYELTGHYLRLKHLLLTDEAKKIALSMLKNPFQVSTMEAHGLVNAIPEARNRFDFLLNQPVQKLNPEKIHESLLANQISPRSCLTTLLEKLKESGFNIIVINQTTKTLKSLGLYCVKVLIPGFVPITFGHQFSRLNVERLRKENGQYLSLEDINPHPFP